MQVCPSCGGRHAAERVHQRCYQNHDTDRRPANSLTLCNAPSGYAEAFYVL